MTDLQQKLRQIGVDAGEVIPQLLGGGHGSTPENAVKVFQAMVEVCGKAVNLKYGSNIGRAGGLAELDELFTAIDQLQAVIGGGADE